MNELIEKLEKDFDEKCYFIRIVDAKWSEDSLRLSIYLKSYDDNSYELWDIQCDGVIEERLCSECAGAIVVSEHSSLLMPFEEPEVDIVFSDNRIDSSLLLGIVFSKCFEFFGRAEFIERFINLKPTSEGVCSVPYGLLGKFPESVANQILNTLKSHPINAKKLSGSIPKRWNGYEFVSYPKLRLLEIGCSYVVAESFNAVRA